MTLHLNLPHRHHSDHQQEIREARRVMKERIRNDWEYPTLPAYTSCGRVRRKIKGKTTEEDEDAGNNDEGDGEGTVAGFRFHTPAAANGERNHALGLDFDPVEWRERQYSSASDTAVDSPATMNSGKGSTYKFENPDSVGAHFKERKIRNKKRRFAALSEEMEWNDGLSHWMRRRDAWCCARSANDVHMLEGAGNNGNHTSDSETAATAEDSSSTSADSNPRSSTSSTSSTTAVQREGEVEEDEEEEASSTAGSSLATTSEIAAVRSDASSTIISPAEVLVPIATPILPNHPVRRKITPSMYPEIYSKIILQSRTPSVPINLKNLIHALVQGWKDDGEWPPKTGPLEKSIGRKKGSGGIREGVKRVLRITGVGEHS